MEDFVVPDIYKNGLYYDLINRFDYDIPFYQSIIDKTGQNVLELACGTGRVAIPLAKSGAKVTGLDASAEMLDFAKVKNSDSGTEIDWIEGDMTKYDLKRKFDVLLCIHNSFCHLNTLDEIKAFFSCASMHMHDESRFVLQLFTPDLDILNRNPEEQFPLISFAIPDSGKKVSITESSYYDESVQVNYLKWYFHQKDEPIFIENFSTRVFFPEELDNLVQLLGFEIENKFGDFDEVSFEEYPDSQILVLKKKQ